jgi:DNA sulfur modification protein DndD
MSSNKSVNFYNYYGSFEQNTYRFREGINIVNADNNMGKSKFYNGILRILKDEVHSKIERGERHAKRKQITVIAKLLQIDKSGLVPKALKIALDKAKNNNLK